MWKAETKEISGRMKLEALAPGIKVGWTHEFQTIAYTTTLSCWSDQMQKVFVQGSRVCLNCRMFLW